MREKGLAIRALLLSGLLMLAGLVLAPSTEAFIYWASGSSIGRADNDGSAVDPSFITGQKTPCGLAVDSQHIYWANHTGPSIGRANLDGSGVQSNFITTEVRLPCGVALDGAHIWWTNLPTSLVPPLQTGQVAVANLNGTNPHVMFQNPQVEGPQGVGVGSGFVFWTNNDASPPSVGRAGTDGTPPPNEHFLDLSSGFRPLAWPTVGGGRLFFTTILGLLSTDLNGGASLSLFGSTAYGGIAVHGARVYWANRTEGTVSSSNLALTSPDFAFIRGLGHPMGIAVDGGRSAAPAPPSPSNPSNQFSFSLEGKRLLVAVGAPGTVDVADASAARGASVAKKKKKKRLLKPSSASGGPPTIEVPLRLTKAAKATLRRKGKVKVRARITFTPTGGAPNSQSARLKVKGKKK